MPGRLDGQIAVITGATSGIGEATAEVFVKEGATVVVAGRSEERGNQIAGRLGDKAVFTRCDVMEESDIKSLIDSTVDRFGRVDTLFNNAGGGNSKGVAEVTLESIDEMTRLLFSSVVLGIKHVIPVMKKQKGGSIINNSSVSAIRMRNSSPIYSSLKAAVLASNIQAQLPHLDDAVVDAAICLYRDFDGDHDGKLVEHEFLSAMKAYVRQSV